MGNFLRWDPDDVIGYGRGDGYCQVIHIARRDAMKGNYSAWYLTDLKVYGKEIGVVKSFYCHVRLEGKAS